MKGIEVQSGGDGPELWWTEVEDAVLRPYEVMVDVHATAVNRADLAQARGAYPPPRGESEILGIGPRTAIKHCGIGSAACRARRGRRFSVARCGHPPL